MAFPLNNTLAIVSFTFSFAYAFGQGLLQDFCVATNDLNATVSANGMLCKDPKLVSVDDFFASGLNVRGKEDGHGIALNPINVDRVAALNTLCLFMIRVDYEPGMLVTPHTHPRSSELIYVVEGALDVGFVTIAPSNQKKNHLYSKTLSPGDVFVIPQGLLHYQANVGTVNAVSINTLNHQNPGIAYIPNQLFGSDPAISENILSKTFKVNENVIQRIRSQFA